jgi:hypothetical protein
MTLPASGDKSGADAVANAVCGETGMARRPRFIDGERIRKAHTLRGVEPVQQQLATALAAVPELRFVKLSPSRLSASNQLSTDGKKNPVVVIGADGITGVELLIDADTRVVQFFAITSAEQGCGRKMVEAVVRATPLDWFLAVPMDWSGGFWQRMARDYPRLQVL